MVLTWSVSRDRILHTCERYYYFQYLTSARINSRDVALKEIAFLKKLQTIPMWQGEVFHLMVADSIYRIRERKSLLSDTWLSGLKKKVEQEWAFSESKRFRDEPRAIDKDGGLALFEHEYDESLEQQSCATVIQSIETWIKRFSTWADQTDLISLVQNAKQVWIEPQIYGAFAPGFFVNDVQVIAKVDLAFLSRNGKFHIFDWKTGIPPLSEGQQLSQAEFQVEVYQLWPHLSLKHPLENIQAHLVYFGSEPVQEQIFHMDQNSVEYTLGLIRRSIVRVRHFGNAEGEAKLSVEDFDFATYLQACQRCSFKRICQRMVEL